MQTHTIYQGFPIPFECMPHEKVLTIQKQHWSALLLLFLSNVAVFALLSFALLYIIQMRFPSIETLVFIDGTILILTVMALFGSYVYIDWYYTYYIVTNKRLIIRHFFKLIGGTYYKEIFLQMGARFEVERVSPNFIYDLLDIEDVYVDFRKLEITEPFVFERPQNPAAIEAALYEIEEYRA